ncbi:biofilm peroxide resistance protein BsmA [Serratia sp. JUb9]|uniref:biofilm peroxide resistance protein BsmA n=1 Tax=Serratia sp. JUb9 TaxID=2724469 RepID=UPI000DA3C228|nr:biofilm peroxide resistance protein BsmA [Serratia sp. JUb9]QNK32154.1 biofilm peroxide resistance protein BsmA [Serratia sp. JUb9]SQJ30403.1 putative biofilm stress and motility protein A [Serratia rubidaea]
MTLTRTAALLTLLTLLAALSGCGLMTTTPKPPPPPIAGQAQEVIRAQTFGLEKMTTVSALVHGSPMNVEDAIQKKATASGARYYLIIMNSETVVPGQWYSQAILYR